MRIAFVGTAYPMRGGIAQYNALLCRALAGAGHEVRLFSFTRQYPGLFFPGKTQYETGADPAPFPAQPMLDSTNPLSWLATARAVTRFRPDLLLFKYWIPFFAPSFGTIARRVARACGSRVVLILDNVIPHERRAFDLPLTRYMLSSADAFVAMSKAVEADLRRFRPDAPCAVVPHPLYTNFGEPEEKTSARAALGWSEDSRVLLFFGYIRRYKGLDVLLEAMPAIHAATGARLMVLGEFYEDRAYYDRIVQEKGIAQLVTMTGDYVPTEHAGCVFSAADLVVLPYRSATQSGIVQIAVQLERPVLCTRVGGLEEMVHDGATGILVPPEDPAAIVEAVRRYYDEAMEPRLAAGTRDVKAALGWDRLASTIVRLAQDR